MSTPSLDHVLDAVIRIDVDFDIKFISDRGRAWLLREVTSVLPHNLTELLHRDDEALFKSTLHSGEAHRMCDVRLLWDTKEHWINVRIYSMATPGQYVLFIMDITSWKKEGAILRHAAEHDALTGLPNRARLQKLTDDIIAQENSLFSLVLLDLDDFQKVNDAYGHAAGDAVLIETTKRLLKIMGPTDILARLGGDVFVILFKDKSASDTQLVLKNVLLAIARPYDANGSTVYLGVSIGVAEYPLHGADYSTMLKNADAAMHMSKNEGRNRITVFAPQRVSADFVIKSAIHNGIQEGEFFMEYQPQFDMQRRIVGVEALMRWHNQTLGVVQPDQFIPIVEESGLMNFLGRWALRYSCHQLKRFHEFDPSFAMSINVSPVQFESENFSQQVIDILDETQIDPHTLILEITESSLMGGQEMIDATLARLRERGIRFSIDDFGTGFSNLSYLTRLPVSSLKVDKAFVSAMGQDAHGSKANKKLITAMINLAHSVDLKVVA